MLAGGSGGGLLYSGLSIFINFAPSPPGLPFSPLVSPFSTSDRWWQSLSLLLKPSLPPFWNFFVGLAGLFVVRPGADLVFDCCSSVCAAPKRVRGRASSLLSSW